MKTLPSSEADAMMWSLNGFLDCAEVSKPSPPSYGICSKRSGRGKGTCPRAFQGVEDDEERRFGSVK